MQEGEFPCLGEVDFGVASQFQSVEAPVAGLGAPAVIPGAFPGGSEPDLDEQADGVSVGYLYVAATLGHDQEVGQGAFRHFQFHDDLPLTLIVMPHQVVRIG